LPWGSTNLYRHTLRKEGSCQNAALWSGVLRPDIRIKLRQFIIRQPQRHALGPNAHDRCPVRTAKSIESRADFAGEWPTKPLGRLAMARNGRRSGIPLQ
jgi:hypothetical protein